jgi:hypothetical protein
MNESTELSPNQNNDFETEQYEAEERLKKLSGDGSRLRKDSTCKVMANGFVEVDGENGYTIEGFPLKPGMELEVKIDTHWFPFQIELDEAGQQFLSAAGVSFYPKKVYGRIIKVLNHR